MSFTKYTEEKKTLLTEIENTQKFLQLEYHSESGLEFINLDRGIKYLKQLADKTKKFIKLNKKENEQLHIKRFDKHNYPIYKLVKDTNYLELQKVEIYIPIALSRPYLDLVTLFDKYQDTGIRLDETHLKPFNVWLINLMNNSDDLSKLTKNDVMHFEKSATIIKDFAECFEGKSGMDVAPYGLLVRRNKDWDEVTELMDTLTETAQSKNLQVVNESLSNSVNLVHDLIELIQNDTKINVSKPVLKELSDSIYNLAQLSNLSSLYLTKMTATTIALEDTYTRLSEIINKK